MRPPIFPDGRGKGGKQHRRRRSDAQAAGLAAGGPAGRVDGALDARQNPPRFLHQNRAGVGQPGLAAAFEDPAAKLPLELLDLLRQRRLGDPDALGGAPEMQFFRHRKEITKLAQVRSIHMRIVSILRSEHIGHIGGTGPTLAS